MAEALRIAPEQRYRNALLWIRTIAGMHYFGDAFNPEHMRALANLAADALSTCADAAAAAKVCVQRKLELVAAP